MKKSDEYLFDTIKNIGVGVIVASLLGILLSEKPIADWRLTYIFIWGIMIDAGGYVLLRQQEDNEE